MQPSLTDANFAVLVRAGHRRLEAAPGFTPTLELDYADGGSQGNGYMEVWSANPKTISGTAPVRETFKVTGPSRTFTRIMVRLQRLAGTSPLTVLDEADGTLVEQGTVPAASLLDRRPSWVTVHLPPGHGPRHRASPTT